MEYLLPAVERGIIITCSSTMVRCGADCAAGAQGFSEAPGKWWEMERLLLATRKAGPATRGCFEGGIRADGLGAMGRVTETGCDP